MFQKDLKYIINKEFKNVFIVDNRNSWINCISLFNAKTDVIFCIDFGLKYELENSGANIYFLDHIVEPVLLQEANYQMHHFLDNWYKNKLGEDLLIYKKLKLGDALLLNIITNITSFCHFFFNIIAIKKLNYEKLYLAIEDNIVHDVFNKLDFKYCSINLPQKKSSHSNYAFPISYWINTKLYKNSVINKIIFIFKMTLSFLHSLIDIFSKNKINIYIQDYHPTQPIIKDINDLEDVLVRTPEFSLKRPIFKQRRIPKRFFPPKKVEAKAKALLNEFILADKADWYYEGYNLSDSLYDILIRVVADNILEACSTADTITNHFNKINYSLVIPVTNFWLENRLILNYAKNNNIPIFMIVNGLLNLSFEIDGKDSDYINCYSQTVKEDYFNNLENSLCLGDPRMDKYFLYQRKQIDRKNPVIIIGTAGFNSIDLNSYLAYEFDFLFDILFVLAELKNNGLNNKIILKVRDNGLVDQYHYFVNEYFPELDIDIVQDISFSNLIVKADLYISIYSQSLIEASFLEVPVIYYKKDTQFINRPFDCKCELVTASDINELQDKIEMFYNGSNAYDEFMKKSVLEKYIGPLDGLNTKRNIQFINQLIKKNNNK